jgi:phosphoesterase RecJ-like protein
MMVDKLILEMKKSENIVILPHIQADGDGLGASLALGLALKKMSKKVKILLEEPISFTYEFLPGKELTQLYSQGIESEFEKYDLAIALDTGDIERLGKRAPIFEKSKVTINIDHHNTNSEFACFNYVQAGLSSVGEMMYSLLDIMELNIDKDIATCLYTSIISDTGGFRYSNTKPDTHRIAAELIDKGVDVAEISRRVFETNSLEKIKLMAHAINSLQLYEDGKIAIISIGEQTMKDEGATEDDCNGMVNIGRDIQGVEVAIMLRECDDNSVKVNLRSNGYLDVSAIANQFSGGGHKKASGCIVKGSLEEVKIKLVDSIKKALMD